MKFQSKSQVKKGYFLRLLQTKVQPGNKIKRRELQGLKAVLLLVYGALVFLSMKKPLLK